MKNYSKDFPIFKNNPHLVFLDSGASSQKPRQVIQAETDWYSKYHANIHRGVYPLSENASLLIDKARAKTAKFFHCQVEEIVFTKGATESLNLVAYAWAKKNLKPNDVILISEMEHHANLVPWQELARSQKLILRYWPINKNGELDWKNIERLLKGVKLISITHISNVLGTINPVEKISRLAKKHKIALIIDGAQSAGHMLINLKKINCDFYVCAGHKMLGPTGVGVLYINQRRINEMGIYQTGGDMILSVDWQKTTYQPSLQRLEAGTPALAQIYAFGEAISYLEKIGLRKIEKHISKLTNYCFQELKKISELTIYGPKKRGGVIAFSVKNIHAHDLASLLAEKNICLRAGSHCAQPLHEKLGTPATLRASFHIYNTSKDIDFFIKQLKNIIKLWQRSIPQN